MKYSTLLLFALCLLWGQVSGQTLKALEKAGDEALVQKNYYTAMVHFSDALSIDPENIRLCYKYAEVARYFNAYETALVYYGKVSASEQAGQFPMALFRQAQLSRNLGKFRVADSLFVCFLSMEIDPWYQERTREEIAWCRKAMKGEFSPDPYIQTERSGKQINTEYSEFAPLERGDTLFYTAYRFDKPDEKKPLGRKISKLMFSVRNGRGRALSRGMNDEALSTAHVTFSTDHKRMYFTLCDYVSEAELRCKLYYRERDKYGKWSRKATELPSFINQEGYTATQPAIVFDSIAMQERLIYVSDRPGGKGLLDLWFAAVDEKGFSKPEPLEALNTPDNELSPYFDPASQTLYFSTDGRAGWGELDIWQSRLDSSRWSMPEILPAPVNSGYDDLYFSLSDQVDIAWMASNRPGSLYLDPDNKACCYDIYRVAWLPEPPPGDTVTPPVTLRPPSESPPESRETPPGTLEEFLPLALYFDNDEPDKRTQRTTTRKTYGSTFDRYYQRKGEYLEEYARPLAEDLRYEAETSMEAFFEEEVRKGFEHLGLFSEILLQRLEAGDRVEIFIKGYTSPRARSDYNLALGQRRISSVRNHFQSYRDGIFQPYLASGMLHLTERSFGETQAARDVSDELEDLRNSVFSIGAARERRVEIVEVQRDGID
jgi:tetratricopeptide (TPR) repeat protein